jgi:mitochondrial fission protein ELM1
MPVNSGKKTICWVITEGIAGTENQCLGVAEALGIEPDVKRIKLRQPWKILSPYIGFESGNSFLPKLEGPWPDIVIAGGRKAIAAARYIKKSSNGKTFTALIQDPRIATDQFDLVAVPAHDPSRGSNVIVTTASPNRVTPERLKKAKEQFASLETLRRPRIAVLVGGSSKAYRMTSGIMKKLAGQLKEIDGGLMITTSRRTGAQNEKILRDALKDSNVYIWDGKGENPYFGFLAWADYILVTADSASMLSESCTTGKPVYMIPLEGGSKRLNKLHENLLQAGVLRIFDGHLESWTYEPLRDAQKVAGEIKRLWKPAG